MSDPRRIVADWLRGAKSAVAFTGAGISTESGIPDFRSPGGVWSKTQPVLYSDFLASAEARYQYWAQKSESHESFSQAKPNAGHSVLADWEERRVIRGVITQNIDGLHQLAGNRQVVELHGTAREIECLDCGHRYDAEDMVARFQEDDRVPECPACSGYLKHATISFGQALDDETIRTASNWAGSADVFFALGSSLVVHPAAGLPELAKQRGARLVIINRESTPLDGMADVVISAPLGQTLSAIDGFLSDGSSR